MSVVGWWLPPDLKPWQRRWSAVMILIGIVLFVHACFFASITTAVYEYPTALFIFVLTMFVEQAWRNSALTERLRDLESKLEARILERA